MAGDKQGNVPEWGRAQDQEQPLRDAERERHAAFERKWQSLVLQSMPTAENEVRRAVKTWNQRIREQLRNETGFVFRTPDASAQVRVIVEAGIPRQLATLLDDKMHKYAPYLLRLNQIREGAAAARLIGPHALDAFTLVERYPPKAPGAETITAVGTLFSDFVAQLEKLDLPGKILQVEEDVLGAYRFRRGQIAIFWVPIALVGGSKGFPIEALTFVVLAHELAHAYTHVGLDINREDWATDAFAKAPLVLVEGWAQYYTEQICRRFEETFPAALNVFNELKKMQSAVYTDYDQWEGSDNSEDMRTRLRAESGRINAAQKRLAKKGAAGIDEKL